jgi:hypothetical protein
MNTRRMVNQLTRISYMCGIVFLLASMLLSAINLPVRAEGETATNTPAAQTTDASNSGEQQQPVQEETAVITETPVPSGLIISTVEVPPTEEVVVTEEVPAEEVAPTDVVATKEIIPTDEVVTPATLVCVTPDGDGSGTALFSDGSRLDYSGDSVVNGDVTVAVTEDTAICPALPEESLAAISLVCVTPNTDVTGGLAIFSDGASVAYTGSEAIYSEQTFPVSADTAICPTLDGVMATPFYSLTADPDGAICQYAPGPLLVNAYVTVRDIPEGQTAALRMCAYEVHPVNTRADNSYYDCVIYPVGNGENQVFTHVENWPGIHTGDTIVETHMDITLYTPGGGFLTEGQDYFWSVDYNCQPTDTLTVSGSCGLNASQTGYTANFTVDNVGNIPYYWTTDNGVTWTQGVGNSFSVAYDGVTALTGMITWGANLSASTTITDVCPAPPSLGLSGSCDLKPTQDGLLATFNVSNPANLPYTYSINGAPALQGNGSSFQVPYDGVSTINATIYWWAGSATASISSENCPASGLGLSGSCALNDSSTGYTVDFTVTNSNAYTIIFNWTAGTSSGSGSVPGFSSVPFSVPYDDVSAPLAASVTWWGGTTSTSVDGSMAGTCPAPPNLSVAGSCGMNITNNGYTATFMVTNPLNVHYQWSTDGVTWFESNGNTFDVSYDGVLPLSATIKWWAGSASTTIAPGSCPAPSLVLNGSCGLNELRNGHLATFAVTNPNSFDIYYTWSAGGSTGDGTVAHNNSDSFAVNYSGGAPLTATISWWSGSTSATIDAESCPMTDRLDVSGSCGLNANNDGWTVTFTVTNPTNHTMTFDWVAGANHGEGLSLDANQSTSFDMPYSNSGPLTTTVTWLGGSASTTINGNCPAGPQLTITGACALNQASTGYLATFTISNPNNLPVVYSWSGNGQSGNNITLAPNSSEPITFIYNGTSGLTTTINWWAGTASATVNGSMAGTCPAPPSIGLAGSCSLNRTNNGYLANFNVTNPANLTYEWSIDGTTWTTSTAATFSVPSDGVNEITATVRWWAGSKSATVNPASCMPPVLNLQGACGLNDLHNGNTATFTVSNPNTFGLTFTWSAGGLSGNGTVPALGSVTFRVDYDNISPLTASISWWAGSKNATVNPGNCPMLDNLNVSGACGLNLSHDGYSANFTVTNPTDRTITFDWVAGSNHGEGIALAAYTSRNIVVDYNGTLPLTATILWAGGSRSATLNGSVAGVCPAAPVLTIMGSCTLNELHNGYLTTFTISNPNSYEVVFSWSAGALGGNNITLPPNSSQPIPIVYDGVSVLTVTVSWWAGSVSATLDGSVPGTCPMTDNLEISGACGLNQTNDGYSATFTVTNPTDHPISFDWVAGSNHAENISVPATDTYDIVVAYDGITPLTSTISWLGGSASASIDGSVPGTCPAAPFLKITGSCGLNEVNNGYMATFTVTNPNSFAIVFSWAIGTETGTDVYLAANDSTTIPVIYDGAGLLVATITWWSGTASAMVDNSIPGTCPMTDTLNISGACGLNETQNGYTATFTVVNPTDHIIAFDWSSVALGETGINLPATSSSSIVISYDGLAPLTVTISWPGGTKSATIDANPQSKECPVIPVLTVSGVCTEDTNQTGYMAIFTLVNPTNAPYEWSTDGITWHNGDGNTFNTAYDGTNLPSQTGYIRWWDGTQTMTYAVQSETCPASYSIAVLNNNYTCLNQPDTFVAHFLILLNLPYGTTANLETQWQQTIGVNVTNQDGSTIWDLVDGTQTVDVSAPWPGIWPGNQNITLKWTGKLHLVTIETTQQVAEVSTTNAYDAITDRDKCEQPEPKDLAILQPFCAQPGGEGTAWKLEWVIQNLNQWNVPFTWKLDGVAQGVDSLILPGAHNMVLTLTDTHSHTVELSWIGGSTSLTSQSKICENVEPTPTEVPTITPPPPPTETQVPPDVIPVTGVVVDTLPAPASEGVLLIPVTGIDLKTPVQKGLLHNFLASLGFAFLGISLVLQGWKRKLGE